MTKNEALKIVISLANKAHHQNIGQEKKGVFSSQSSAIIKDHFNDGYTADSMKIFTL